MNRRRRISFKEKQRRRNQALYHQGKSITVTSSGKAVVIYESDLADPATLEHAPVNELHGKKLEDYL